MIICLTVSKSNLPCLTYGYGSTLIVTLSYMYPFLGNLGTYSLASIVVTPVTDVFNLNDESDVDHTPEVDIVEDNEDLIVLDELEIEPEDLIDEEENA